MQLDTVYRSPGFLLLAESADGDRLGCVGARAIDGPAEERRCELRRLYVRPDGRGTGLGRRLAERVIADAGDAGFGAVVLNTLPQMREAITLYQSLGFAPIEPYDEDPDERVLYFGLSL